MIQCLLLQSWLEKKSFEVKYTGDPNEVPALIREFKPQVALVDILQKEVIHKIKVLDETSNIPVILMTGYAAKHQPVLLPVDDHIEKPFKLNLLEKKIRKFI